MYRLLEPGICQSERRKEKAIHELDIEVARLDRCAVVRVDGDLTSATAPVLVEAVGDALHRDGRVIVDVAKMQLEEAEPLMLLAALQAEAGGWPWVKLAVCGGDHAFESAFARDVGPFVPLYASPSEAAARLDDRPPRVWQHRHLEGTSNAPAQARRLLGEVCTAWRLPDRLAEAVVLATSELVTNAVEHAKSDVDIWLDLDAEGLRISVRDASPVLPIHRQHDVTSPRGRGIAMVDAIADRWGVLSHEDGKTVWIFLRWPDQ